MTRTRCVSDFGAVEDAILVRPMHAGSEDYVGKVARVSVNSN